MVTVGTRLKIERSRSGMLQMDVAASLEVPATTLANYENDRYPPPIWFVQRAAQLYGVSSDYLLGLTDDRTPGSPSVADDIIHPLLETPEFARLPVEAKLEVADYLAFKLNQVKKARKDG